MSSIDMTLVPQPMPSIPVMCRPVADLVFPAAFMSQLASSLHGGVSLANAFRSAAVTGDGLHIAVTMSGATYPNTTINFDDHEGFGLITFIFDIAGNFLCQLPQLCAPSIVPTPLNTPGIVPGQVTGSPIFVSDVITCVVFDNTSTPGAANGNLAICSKTTGKILTQARLTVGAIQGDPNNTPVTFPEYPYIASFQGLMPLPFQLANTASAGEHFAFAYTVLDRALFTVSEIASQKYPQIGNNAPNLDKTMRAFCYFSLTNLFNNFTVFQPSMQPRNGTLSTTTFAGLSIPAYESYEMPSSFVSLSGQMLLSGQTLADVQTTNYSCGAWVCGQASLIAQNQFFDVSTPHLANQFGFSSAIKKTQNLTPALSSALGMTQASFTYPAVGMSCEPHSTMNFNFRAPVTNPSANWSISTLATALAPDDAVGWSDPVAPNWTNYVNANNTVSSFLRSSTPAGYTNVDAYNFPISRGRTIAPFVLGDFDYKNRGFMCTNTSKAVYTHSAENKNAIATPHAAFVDRGRCFAIFSSDPAATPGQYINNLVYNYNVGQYQFGSAATVLTLYIATLPTAPPIIKSCANFAGHISATHSSQKPF